MSALEIKALFSRPGTPAYPFRDDRGQLCWLESLTEEGGRIALKQTRADDERVITPPEFQIRSRVHEYGGKCFCIAGDQLYFNNFDDGLIYRQNLHQDGQPVLVSGQEIGSLSYADLHYSKALNAICAVQELENPSGGENTNRLVAFLLKEPGPQIPRVLVQGADFYAAPCVSEDGTQLAWLQWSHPNMPWDASCLMQARIGLAGGAISVAEAQLRAGGENSSVCQPGYLHNGRLLFAMDQDGRTDSPAAYWNLYLGEERETNPLTTCQAEFGEAHWVFGQHRWVQPGESRIVAVMTEEESDCLQEIDLGTGERVCRVGPCARLSQLSTRGGAVQCIAEYVDRPAEIIELSAQGAVSVLKSESAWLDKTAVSLPQPICYPTQDGAQAYANYYPAKPQSDQGTPSLLVLVHGGPTARSDTALKPLVQYFTQNGFSILDVNHRGSTGHGRAYRQALLGQWGEIDASDVADAIRFMVTEKGLDAKRVFIRGGSAGGYAVLRALTRFPELFCGGACYYGIGNLITLSEITHKFEGRYTDRLIGERYTPETANLAGSLFRSRSPIFDIDYIQSPLILFQGLDDKVVPPEVSREMVETLAQNNIKHEYIEYEGEGHGFRKAQTRIDALSREIAFYQEILQGLE